MSAWSNMNDRKPMHTVSLLDSLFEYSNQKIWYCWDNNLSELTDVLKERVIGYLRKYQHKTDYKSHETDINLALWLLDHLLPLNEKDIFVPFLGEMSLRNLGINISEGNQTSARPWKRAILAWGRRLSNEHRSQLLLIPFNQPQSEKKEKSRRRLCYPVGQEVMAAWCETCPVGQEDTLLTLPDSDMCQTHHAPEDISILVKEYVRRNPNRTERLPALINNAAKLIDIKEKYGEQKWGIQFHLLHHIFKQIMKDIAPEFVLNDKLPGGWRNSSEDWYNWLTTVLSKAGYDSVVNLYRHLNPYREGHLLAVLFRIETMNWQQLERHISGLDNLPHDGFIDRLADIVPSERLDVWKMVLKLEKNHYSFVAFCRWLQPEYRDALLWYCNLYEVNCTKAVCAFYSYLSKTPHPVLEAMWQCAKSLPTWQSQELDRCLFAPEPIKPPQLLWDRQNIEADLRLEDLLSHRIMY